MSHEILLDIIAVGGIAAAIYCVVSALQYRQSRKRFEQITGEYLSVVNRDVQQGTAESLADHINLCGGCGGHFLTSVIDACPGKDKCPNYQNIIAERDMS